MFKSGRESEMKNTKERILNAAEKLFAEHGFDAASLRGITAEAVRSTESTAPGDADGISIRGRGQAGEAGKIDARIRRAGISHASRFNHQCN
ncbi:MAG: hypothetical protein H6Q04_2844 [Acidobacteria bacterium]|nr:hypothetical protein [Acidobacteriota bacterium]